MINADFTSPPSTSTCSSTSHPNGIERETGGEFLLEIQQFRNPSSHYYAIFNVFADHRLYIDTQFSRNVFNIYLKFLQNELFYTANVLWCDGGLQSKIMRLILNGFEAVLEFFLHTKNECQYIAQRRFSLEVHSWSKHACETCASDGNYAKLFVRDPVITYSSHDLQNTCAPSTTFVSNIFEPP